MIFLSLFFLLFCLILIFLSLAVCCHLFCLGGVKLYQIERGFLIMPRKKKYKEPVLFAAPRTVSFAALPLHSPSGISPSPGGRSRFPSLKGDFTARVVNLLFMTPLTGFFPVSECPETFIKPYLTICVKSFHLPRS